MKTKPNKLSKKALELGRGLDVHAARCGPPDGEPELFGGSHSGAGIRRTAVEEDSLSGL